MTHKLSPYKTLKKKLGKGYNSGRSYSAKEMSEGRKKKGLDTRTKKK